MNTHFREDDSPLEGRTVEMLTLTTMAVFRIHRIPMKLEGDITAPALTTGRLDVRQVVSHDNTCLKCLGTNLSLVQLYGGLARKSSSVSPPCWLGMGPAQPVSGVGL